MSRFKPTINVNYLSLRTYMDTIYYFEYDKEHITDIVPKSRIGNNFVVNNDISIEYFADEDAIDEIMNVTVVVSDGLENKDIKASYVMDKNTALLFKEELISEGLI